MRILFAGDSITKGNVGVGFVDLIRRENTGYIIKNIGRNGETFNNISKRLLIELHSGTSYDYIIIQGGYNDIFLPHFLHKGRLFSFALKQQLKKGNIPVNSAGCIKLEWNKTICQVKEMYKGKIILLTLGCINENMLFQLNTTRLTYNNIIREIADENNCLLADPASCFDHILKKQQQTNYFLESFISTAFLDSLICRIKNGADFLSRRRNLLLTIDGVHLNSLGASIYKEAVMDLVRQDRN